MQSDRDGFVAIRNYWISIGLPAAIAKPLAEANIRDIPEVRAFGAHGCLQLPNIGKVAVSEIGKAIGGWDTPPFPVVIRQPIQPAFTPDDLSLICACLDDMTSSLESGGRIGSDRYIPMNAYLIAKIRVLRDYIDRCERGESDGTHTGSV